MSLDQPIAICCSNCGGRKVRADAYAAWCDELQMWELASIFDQRFFEDCGCDVDSYELPLDHGAEGSRKSHRSEPVKVAIDDAVNLGIGLIITQGRFNRTTAKPT